MLNTNPSLDSPQDARQRPPEQALNRACEGCRLLKIRCIPVDSATSTICQRCQRSGRMCVYALPQKRRQRKRTDTRVADLEREVKAMRSQLYGDNGHLMNNARPNRGTPSSIVSKEFGESEAGRATPSPATGERSSEGGDMSGQPSDSMLESQSTDEIIPSLSRFMPALSFGNGTPAAFFASEKAVKLFESYNKDLVHHYPGVIFPEYCTPENVRRTKPILFQAAVIAAACQVSGDLFEELFNGIVKLYGEQIFIEGEKSLEMVQALTLTAVWYCPPEHQYGHCKLQFYQYLHMAATMAVELGIGMKLDGTINSLEESRALLSSYLCCAGSSKRMRRPNMLRWSNEMANCLKVLEESQFSSMLDKRLAAWVRLQNIADEWAADTVIESRKDILLKGVERQLKMWKSDLKPGLLNTSLLMAYHQERIHLYESALEGGTTILLDFNHKHFDPSKTLQSSQQQGPISAFQLNAIIACIDSCHALLDEFLTFDIPTLQQIPVILFVRVAYAIVVLVKIFYSIIPPQSELGKILDPHVLKLDLYLKNVIQNLAAAGELKKLRVPTKWLAIIRGIDVWYQRALRLLKQKEKQTNSLGGGSEAIKTTQETLNTNARAEDSTFMSNNTLRDLSVFPSSNGVQQQQAPFHAAKTDDIQNGAHNPQVALSQINWSGSTIAQAITAAAPLNFSQDATVPNYSPKTMDFAPANEFSAVHNSSLDFMGSDFGGWAPGNNVSDGLDSMNGMGFVDYEDYNGYGDDGSNHNLGGNWDFGFG